MKKGEKVKMGEGSELREASYRVEVRGQRSKVMFGQSMKEKYLRQSIPRYEAVRFLFHLIINTLRLPI